MKTCKVCKTELILDKTWGHYKVLLCYKHYSDHRMKSYYSEWDRKRLIGRLSDHKRRNTEERKAHNIDSCKRMYKKYPEKYRARAKLHYAVSIGKIKKLPCNICGKTEKIHAHHHMGYEGENWKNVVWLCASHHTEAHIEKKRLTLTFILGRDI